MKVYIIIYQHQIKNKVKVFSHNIPIEEINREVQRAPRDDVAITEVTALECEVLESI